jgi:predicted RNase H-like HicB family nuclease
VSTVAEPHPGRTDHEQLTIELVDTGEGWWSARIEGTGAISQGRTRDEARRNVVAALFALEHDPRPLERLAWRLQALIDNVRQR